MAICKKNQQLLLVRGLTHLEDIDHGDALVIEKVLDDLSDKLDVTAAFAGDLLDVSHPVDVRHHLTTPRAKALGQPTTPNKKPRWNPASQSYLLHGEVPLFRHQRVDVFYPYGDLVWVHFRRWRPFGKQVQVYRVGSILKEGEKEKCEVK
jgi:hypothetical protein